MIVVTTPTGQIGSALVRRLLAENQDVRVVVRDPARLSDEVRDRTEVIVGSHGDPAVLDTALPGADALFWLVPPDRSAASARDHYLGMAQVASAALRRHGVGHVVGVTSAGHGWAPSAGVLSAAFAMDDELAASGAAYTALSMPFYLENLLGQVESIARDGAFSLAVAADQAFATVAIDDIATTAARLLTDRAWEGRRDLPLFGPDRLTPAGMAEVMSRELGRPVAFRPVSIEDMAGAMRAAGAGEQAVRDTTEMFVAQADGIYDVDWAVAELGPTDVATWCRTVLAPRVMLV